MKVKQVVSVLTAERDTAAKRVAQLDLAISALSNGTGNAPSRGKRVLSVAARKRISAAQIARWKKYHKVRKSAA